MEFKTLYNEAYAIAKEKKLNEKTTACQVGVAILGENGKIYRGCSLQTGCSLGFCAEAIAVGNILMDGEYIITKIIAVNEKGEIYSPCGKCREMIYQISQNNLKCEVMLKDKIVLLEELLPEL